MAKKQNVKYRSKANKRAMQRWNGAQKILKLCARAAPINTSPLGIYQLNQVTEMNI